MNAHSPFTPTVSALIADPELANLILPNATCMSLGALLINLCRAVRDDAPERRLGLISLREAFGKAAFRDAWVGMREKMMEEV